MRNRWLGSRSGRMWVFSLVLMGASQASGQAPATFCPDDPAQEVFAPANPDYLGIVANELLIPVAYHANLAFLAQQYRRAGVGHARVVLNWEAIQPNPPEVSSGYDWGLTDLQVSSMANSGLRTLGIITTTPAWASSCSLLGGPVSIVPYYRCLPTPNRMVDYESFVRALVQRYGPGGTGQIRDWEIRVENTAQQNNISKEHYVIELNAAYSVIHQVDAGAQVWGPEIAFLPSGSQNAAAHDFATYVIAHGNLDIFSIHLFPHWSMDASKFALDTTASVCAELGCNAPFGIPLAVTAMNVLVDDSNPSDETTQAANLRDMYVCAWAGGADYAMWFAGTQWRGKTNQIPCDQAYGIFEYVSVVNPYPNDPWVCAPDMPTPPDPNKVIPRDAYATLQSLGTDVIGQLPQGAPCGVLGVSSNPCKLGTSGCSATLYWYSTGIAQPKVQLRRAGVLAHCTDSNKEDSVTITFTAPSTRSYALYAADSCSSAPLGNPIAQLMASAAN